MTQYLEALSGNVTPEMIAVANSEFHEPETIRREIAEGRLVIPANKVHLQKHLQPIDIGIALRTKINADCEIAKVQYAVKYGRMFFAG